MRQKPIHGDGIQQQSLLLSMLIANVAKEIVTKYVYIKKVCLHRNFLKVATFHLLLLLLLSFHLLETKQRITSANPAPLLKRYYLLVRLKTLTHFGKLNNHSFILSFMNDILDIMQAWHFRLPIREAELFSNRKNIHLFEMEFVTKQQTKLSTS